MARLQIDMLPVGDSDAFLVEVQSDGAPEVILIDGGKNWEDGERVLRQLEAYYGGRVDHLVLSHIDADHVGGLLHIVENLEPDRLGQAWVHDVSKHGVVTEAAVKIARELAQEAQSTAVRDVATHMADSVEGVARLIEALTAKGVPVQEPFANGTNRIGPFEVLGPTERFFTECIGFFSDPDMLGAIVEQGISLRRRKSAGVGPAAPDEAIREAADDPVTTRQASLIMLLEYEGDRYLFAGDAGRMGFRACPGLEKARGLHWLKVPNHGAPNNLSPELLDMLHPALAYISTAGVGINPHPALVAALESRGAVIYTTARSGNVWHRRGDVPPRAGFETRRPM